MGAKGLHGESTISENHAVVHAFRQGRLDRSAAQSIPIPLIRTARLLEPSILLRRVQHALRMASQDRGDPT